VRVWLETPFEGGRHERRLAKVSDLDHVRAQGEVAGAPAH